MASHKHATEALRHQGVSYDTVSHGEVFDISKGMLSVRFIDADGHRHVRCHQCHIERETETITPDLDWK